MIKVEVIETFTLGRFGELKNIERHNQNTQGKLYVGDKFECSEELADYLTGNNPLNKVVVKVIEVIPVKDAKYEEKKDVKEKKTSKKVAKRKEK